MSSTSSSYYIFQGGQQSGPYTLDQMRVFWQDGNINEQSYYWRDGMKDWGSLAELAGPLSADSDPVSPGDEGAEKANIFLFEKGAQTGPFTPEKLKQRYGAGEITESTFFWKEGMDAWKPLREIAAQIKDPNTASGVHDIARDGKVMMDQTGSTIVLHSEAVIGPFREFVVRDLKEFGEGPIAPQDPKGPYFEILAGGKTPLRLSLTELRHGWQSGALKPDLSCRTDGEKEWRPLSELQGQLN